MPMNRRYLANTIGISLLWLCGILTIVILLLITLYILLERHRPDQLGFPADIAGTCRPGGRHIPDHRGHIVHNGDRAARLRTPLSVGGAIYMAEYAGESRITQLVRFGADSLAGIPSIMIGLFGYLLFVIYLGFGFSLLSGSLAVAFMALPIILRVSEEAIKVVPAILQGRQPGTGQHQVADDTPG